MSLSYPTDLTDAQWELIQSLLPQAKPGGRPRSTDLRSVVNALFYVLMGGIAWRLLPHDFPKWQTVYHYFRQWRDDGTLQKINQQFYQWERTAGHDRPFHPAMQWWIASRRSLSFAEVWTQQRWFLKLWVWMAINSNSHFRVYVLKIGIETAFLPKSLNGIVKLSASPDRAVFP